MPQVQTLGGRDVTSPILLVTGGSRRFKILPVAPERLPFTISRTRLPLVEVERVDNRVGPNFATFSLRATGAGDTEIQIGAASGGTPIKLGVRVIAPVALPDESTDVGMLTRLFLAENEAPGAGYSATDAAETMTLMHVVLLNRLRRPDGRWASAGARSLRDVVRAPGQFRGFENYPTIAAATQSTIDGLLRIANDANNPLLPAMRAHIALAIAQAAERAPADPTRTGLFWWRTENSGSPGTGVVRFKTVGGNTFWREGP